MIIFDAIDAVFCLICPHDFLFIGDEPLTKFDLIKVRT